MAQKANADDGSEIESADQALETLRRLFDRPHHTVEREDGVMGDYSVEVSDGSCFHENRHSCLSNLDFKLGSIHQHPEGERMTVYINDTRSEGDR
jgi:hypothetical protein